jgi:hypothetical protein
LSAVDTNFATTVHANSVIGHLADNGAGFDRTTDSLEAIRDRGDAAWITATGFSTHSASDVWAVGTRTITGGTIGTLSTDTITAAAISAAGANKIADHVRRRTQANVEASSDGDSLSLSSEYGAIQQMQESSVSGGTLTVRRTDGSTSLGTKTLTSDADAEPIIGIA